MIEMIKEMKDPEGPPLRRDGGEVQVVQYSVGGAPFFILIASNIYCIGIPFIYLYKESIKYLKTILELTLICVY